MCGKNVNYQQKLRLIKTNMIDKIINMNVLEAFIHVCIMKIQAL